MNIQEIQTVAVQSEVQVSWWGQLDPNAGLMMCYWAGEMRLCGVDEEIEDEEMEDEEMKLCWLMGEVIGF